MFKTNKIIIVFIFLILSFTILISYNQMIPIETEEPNTKNRITNYKDSNRIKEIEEVGYFKDNAGNKFDAYYNSNHFEIYYDNTNVNNKMYAMSIS